MEMVRVSFIPLIATTAFIGYTQSPQPWLLQPLSIFGIYGIDLLIMLGNYALAQGFFVLLDQKWKWYDAPHLDSSPARRWLLAFGILFAAWTGLSLILFIHPPSAEVHTVRVAAIQPDLPRAAHRDSSTPPEQRLAILSAQTRQAAAQGAQIIVWPEMALAFDPQVEHTQELHALAAETQTYIVIAYVIDIKEGFRNETTVLAPSDEFLGIYGKTHPTVFSGEPKTISRGVYPVYSTPVGTLATMICFDADFTDVARQYGQQNVQLIAAPSLFGRSIAEMPYTQIVFRAIENRTAIVMADVAYNSGIIDPYGRVLKLVITPEGSQATLVADVTLETGKTLYSQFGDWLGWLSLNGLILFAIFMPVRLKRP
jgi:apolipoprotein N-acyltransferase